MVEAKKPRCETGKVRNPKTGRCIKKENLGKAKTSTEPAKKSKKKVVKLTVIDDDPIDNIPIAVRLTQKRAEWKETNPVKSIALPKSKKTKAVSTAQSKKTKAVSVAKKVKSPKSVKSPKQSKVVKKAKETKDAKTKPTPPEKDPLRIFYTSLLKQNPQSKMARDWCKRHGLL